MVQECSLDRDSALRLAGDVPRVPYSEMVYTLLHARLLAWSEGGESGARPLLVWGGQRFGHPLGTFVPIPHVGHPPK